jgi:Ca-activated chloride channel family protein
MTFGAPQWFWTMLALPVLLLLFVRAERRGAERLRQFVSPRLLPQLADRVDYFRRRLKFALQLAGLACAIAALAQPRWGYEFAEARRKGIDLLIAVDTSRSMLSNDVQPNRLERVKLAAQDLINQLEGDRVGLIAFAGRAFVQAPLTVDYGAAIEAIRDLDTKTIPEGGTNISEAITLADKTYGKSATGNRALIIFTDGEELSGDAVKTAKSAAEGGARIFTVGVGTPQGSLIPIAGDDGGNAFVKDAKGQVVKSRLDEKRLREIAEATGGFYLHLENGPATMHQLVTDGIGKMKAGDIDARLSRRPIERYEWPLGAGLLAFVFSFLIGDRKRIRQAALPLQARKSKTLAAATALLLFSLQQSFGEAPGLDAYRGGQFEEAYQKFQDTLKAHPETGATDKLQFDTGAAAYKLQDYGKALESFSQALLSPDKGLQEKSHYNLGNTLYQRGEKQKGDEKKLTDWNNALQHYEQAMKLEPQDKEAKENYDYVKKKIDELKNKPKPTPTPSPSPQKKQDKKDQQKKQDQSEQKDKQDQQQSGGQDQQQQQQDKQQQSKDGSDQQNKEQENQGQSDSKNQQDSKQDQQNPTGGSTPSPTPGKEGSSPSPSPGEGDKKDDSSKEGEPSPTPGDGEGPTKPSPSPGDNEGAGENGTPSPTPGNSPGKKPAGDLKGTNGDQQEKPQSSEEAAADADAEKDGQMSERQAEALLESMKDEEARVQLDERKARRRVYNDW